MVNRAFDRQSIFEDLGELDHVIYLFGEYQRYPDHWSVEDHGPWSSLVERLQAYLLWAGVSNAQALTASDLCNKARIQVRTDIIAAMNSLSLLLSHTSHPHMWDDETVEVLKQRLTEFYALLLEADSRRLEPVAARGALFVHGRPRGATGPLAKFLQALCTRLQSFDTDAVLKELKDLSNGTGKISSIGVDEFDEEGQTVWFIFQENHPVEPRSFKTIRNTLSRLSRNAHPEKR